MLSRLLVSIALASLLTLVVAAQQTVSEAATTPRTLNVTGTAQRMVNPDVGLVVLAVQTQANTVTLAVQQNNTLTTRVISAIQQLNYAHSTVSTVGFNVQPIYTQPAANHPVTSPQRIVGYQVVNQVQVRLPEPDQMKLSSEIGEVLTHGLAAGANRVDSISFTLQNAQSALQDALAEATRNAHAAAAAMAEAAGVQIVHLVTLSSTPYYPQSPTPLFAARGEENMAGVPVIAGPQTIQVTVSASYSIQ